MASDGSGHGSPILEGEYYGSPEGHVVVKSSRPAQHPPSFIEGIEDMEYAMKKRHEPYLVDIIYVVVSLPIEATPVEVIF